MRKVPRRERARTRAVEAGIRVREVRAEFLMLALGAVFHAPQTHLDPVASRVDHHEPPGPAPTAASRRRARRHATPHTTTRSDRRHSRAESALLPAFPRMVREDRT